MSIGNDILSRLSVYQSVLESDMSKGIRWTYRHRRCKKAFSEAVSTRDRNLNCVILVNWALRDLGIVYKGLLNHNNGRVSFGSKQTRESVEKYFNIIKMGETQINLARSGRLNPGDILIHQGHMSVFAKYSGGTVYCYDGGRGNCDGGNEGAAFLRFYGKSPYTNMVVTYVVRSKDSQALPPNMNYDEYGMTNAGINNGATSVVQREITARPIVITKRYEYYTGKRNSNVISFTPEYQGICVDKESAKYSLSVDDVKNEILYCSGWKKYGVIPDQEKIAGLSSSSPDNLERKSLSMWSLYSGMKYGATLEIIGDPTVKVGSYCLVMVYTKYGFPHHTSGIYYIKEAHDSISGGMFTTTLTLRKAGAGEKTAEAYLEGSEDSIQGAQYSSQNNQNMYVVNNGSTGGGVTEGGSGAASNDKVEKAVQWAIGIAKDDSHGYSYGGHGPVDYDCSGLVCEAFKQAGFNHSASYTEDMISGFEAVGFKWILWKDIDSLQRGDILLNPSSHTEIYIGGDQMVGAHDNYDGKTGDSAGNEISVGSFGGTWKGILRYVGNKKDKES